MQPPGGPPPNWYADPTGRNRARFWDGAAWTPHVVTYAGNPTVDPLVPVSQVRQQAEPAAGGPGVPPGVPAWTATDLVPDEGMQAWDAPDGTRPPVAQLPGRVELRVMERNGAWARVAAANGWSGWVDGRLLRPLGG